MSEPATDTAKVNVRPPRSLWGHLLRTVVWSTVALLLLAAAIVAFLRSELALELAIARAVGASEGRLTIEGAQGSLLSTVRVARIAWRGDGADVEADNMALTWSLAGLVTRKVRITGLGAHRITLAFRESDGAIVLPESLTLPLEVEVTNVGVERLEWKVGARAGTITGVAFDYEGGARTHAIRRLRLVTDAGTIAGHAELAATAPFDVQAALDFVGDGSFRDTRADITAKGTLSALQLVARGAARDATVTATAKVSPLAAAPLISAHIEARDLNIARFDDSLPTTHLNATVDAKPEATGFAGALVARNDNPGAIDAGRVPLTAMTARLQWNGSELTLDDIDAQLAGNASVTGRAVLNRDGAPSRWQLAVRNLDLSRVHSTLIATRLSGTLAAEVGGTRQVVRGNLAQSDLAFDFAATVAGRRVDVEHLRARAGTGELTGRGNIALDGTRAFAFTAEAHQLDPARLSGFPAGSLEGTLSARGQLSPAWNVDADLKLAQGSRIDGVPVHGTLRAEAAAKTLRNVAAKFTIASATATATGGVGTPGDKLAFTADVGKMSDLRALLAKHAPFTVPDTLTGTLHLRGQFTSEPGGNGLDLDAQGTGVQWGTLLRAATVDLKTKIGSGGLSLTPAANASRTMKLTLAATKVVVPQGELATFTADANGTLAQHTVAFALSAENIDAKLRFAGGLREPGAASTTTPTWAGTLEALENRGTYAIKLDAPAPIEWSRDRMHIGTAQLQFADGHAKLEDLRWEDGKLSTRGAFDSVPLAALARLAGARLPLHSTLIINGDWSIAATPLLNGMIHVRRERGDLYATEGGSDLPAGIALGISTLDFEARFVDDSLVGTGTLRSQRAGNADARLHIGTLPAGATGRVPFDAPLTASLVADLPSLRPLQPWLGTLAVVDGRAHVDLAATGSLANPVLAGTLNADGVRLDVPQYGVRWQDGRLRAHVANNALVVEDLSFAGGDGRFTAQGTLARAQRDGATSLPQASINWTAEKFRAVNRPDFQLTVNGKGVLAVENGKLALRGAVDILNGRIDYEPTSVGTLSDDVVIVGRPRTAANPAPARDVPLIVELDIGLGDDLRFNGEGLDTQLAGKLSLGAAPNGSLTARGTIRAVNGTYFIFGQRLEIDRGQLIFDGPADNPAIDVVALRRNIGVEAGVEVSGTVRLPRVRLVSNPPVPDGEKLSWLMTGQGLDRASRSDLAALGVASASLLGKGQRPLTTTFANSIGLDDISLRERASAVTSGTTSQVVAFGKRINDRLTLVYEQGLTVANNALRIEYALTRTLTLRAEAGVVSSLGLYFRRSYD